MKRSRRIAFSGFTAFFLVAAAAMFLMTVFPVSAAGSRLSGDADLSGRVDVGDAVLVARIAAQDHDLAGQVTWVMQANSDVNEDGFINGDDLTCLLRYLSRFVPSLSVYVVHQTETTASATVTTTSEATTTTTTATVTTTTVTTTSETTTTETTTAAAPAPQASVLTVGAKTYPVGIPLSQLTGQNAPDEQLTVPYKNGNIIFSVYAKDLAHLCIAVSENDVIAGYYVFGESWQAPDDMAVSEYIDTFSGGSGKTYAILALRSGTSIRYQGLSDKKDFSVFARLNYYAINALRAINGIDPLTWDAKAAQSALSHSREMAEKNFFDHNSSDGTKFSARMESFGIDWSVCAENIDCGYTDPFSAANGWYTSEKGHRHNILNTRLQYIGVGFAYGENSNYGYYGTQDLYAGW